MLLALAVIILLLLAVKALAMYIPSASLGNAVDKVSRMATGIAQAEGYFVPGSLPFRSNNPGALRLYGETDTITVFPSASAGWDALYKQVERILTGLSPYYSLDMNIYQVAQVYTGGDNPEAWAVVVAGAMGITPTTTIREYME